MKPDKVICMNCSKQINKGKWCSDACRKAFSRTKSDTQPGQKGGQTNPDIQEKADISQVGQNPDKLDTFRESLTKTDKTFYDRAMKEWKHPYYNFDEEVRKSVCMQCGANFRTSMRLLKYCSYKCYSEAIGTPQGALYKVRPAMN